MGVGLLTIVIILRANSFSSLSLSILSLSLSILSLSLSILSLSFYCLSSDAKIDDVTEEIFNGKDHVILKPEIDTDATSNADSDATSNANSDATSNANSDATSNANSDATSNADSDADLEKLSTNAKDGSVYPATYYSGPNDDAIQFPRSAGYEDSGHALRQRPPVIPYRNQARGEYYDGDPPPSKKGFQNAQASSKYARGHSEGPLDDATAGHQIKDIIAHEHKNAARSKDEDAHDKRSSTEKGLKERTEIEFFERGKF